MKSILTLILLLNIGQVLGTEIIKKNYERGSIELSITQVEIDEMDSIKLINENYREMRLVCANNPFYRNKQPIIKYKNYYNIPVADFIIDDNKKCLDLQKYLIATFEAINSDSPLIITLNVASKSVSKIIYPDLDPYLLYKTDGDIKNYNKGFNGTLNLN